MEDIELNEIWKQYDSRLQEARILNLQSWALNLQQFERFQKQKASATLNGLARYKLVMVATGILWVAFLIFLVLNSLGWSKIFFVISASAIAIFTSIAIVVYLKHVWLINKINNAASVIEAQEKTIKLQSSTLQTGRILFLQTPFYCTFWFTPALFTDKIFLLVNIPVVLFFTCVSVWLYKNINFKNINKKWFKILFNNREWTSLTKAISFLYEIEEFKKEIVIK